MLIEHKFIADGHIYEALKPVLNASSIIELNGLSEKGAIPLSVLNKASERGTGFDVAVQAYLEDREIPELTPDVDACFRGFLRWADSKEITVACPLQKSMVWEFEDPCDWYIGCTPDLPLIVDGVFTAVETKCTHPLSGAAEQMKRLAWRVQLEIELQGFLHLDIGVPKKVLLHCHPKLRPQENRRKIEKGHEYGDGFQAIPYPENDFDLYCAAVRMACEKLKAGFKLERDYQ